MVTLRVQGSVGAEVTLRYGEVLYPDGTLNVMTSVAGQIKRPGMVCNEHRLSRVFTIALNSHVILTLSQGGPCAPDVAYQSDTYILRGGDVEHFTPRFTWHGFRYVEVNMSNLHMPLTSDMLQGWVMHSNVSSALTFDSSASMLNTIHEMYRNTLMSNVMGVQSDCPHRERVCPLR